MTVVTNLKRINELVSDGYDISVENARDLMDLIART